MNNQAQMLYEFAGFLLDPGRRILMRRGEPVPLSPKAFDALLLLVQNTGRVLEKDELMKALWPESFVEEGNLAQNIFTLRKMLGGHQNGNSFIKTIPRRGYKFVVPVKLLDIPSHLAQSPPPTEYWSEHSPFRGLQVFEPDEACLFFGRDSEAEELLVRLVRFPVLVVVGNSGCGKSSLIRAGLIPALRQGRIQHRDQSSDSSSGFSIMPTAMPMRTEDPRSWRVALIRPSQAPFDYMAEVLPSQLAPSMKLQEQAEFIADCRNKLPLGGETLRNAICALVNSTTEKSSRDHVLLVVDQFEEIFTYTASRELRERYIDGLLAASRWDGSIPVHLVLVLRAEFYSQCLEHRRLSGWLERNLYNVPCMTRDQMREAIAKRLVLAGAYAESGLIDSLLNDFPAESGGLAQLEFVLTQLWNKCGGGFGCTLTTSAYLGISPLQQALTAHTDEVLL